MGTWKGICALGALLAAAFLPFSQPGECSEWSTPAEGLFLAEFMPPQKTPISDDPVRVLKVDPARCSLRILSALDHGGKARTSREWCEEFGLLAAINASMYKENLRSTGYMRNYETINNPSVNPAFGAFMVFNPKDASFPRVRIVDSRRDEGWQGILKGYESVVQNYRIISNGKAVQWPTKDRAYSIAAIGIDRTGKLLLIHSRGHYSTHDFIEILLALPIQVRDAMYLEGGHEASLCLRLNGKWGEWSGIGKIGILKDDRNSPLVPNVIGVAR